MSRTIFIDTQFVVALVNERDQNHERALELADFYAADHFLVTDAVLIEIGNALARKFRREAVEIIGTFLFAKEVEVVPVDTAMLMETFDLYRCHEDKEWGLTDCISFVVMRRIGIAEALTFDHHFIQAGFQALMRIKER